MYPYVPASMAVDDPARPDTTTIVWVKMLAALRDQLSSAAARLTPRSSAA